MRPGHAHAGVVLSLLAVATGVAAVAEIGGAAVDVVGLVAVLLGLVLFSQAVFALIEREPPADAAGDPAPHRLP